MPNDANVIQMPAPRGSETGRDPLGVYIRIGRNDHKEVLDLLARGERGIFGLIIEAPYVERHRELISEAKKRDIDLILDPRTHPMALPGGYSPSLSELPWSKESHHKIADFEGQAGKVLVETMVDFAVDNGFTQLLGPTHIVSSPNDRWLRRDIEATNWAANHIARKASKLLLLYPLSIPMDVFRKSPERHAFVSAISDAVCDGIWLRIENFGDDASGEKTAAYIEACHDFHERGLPIVGDYVGGLPASAALAFGAIGGVAHGVTVGQNYKVSRWRLPFKESGGGGGGYRIYVPSLDMLLKPSLADALIKHSPRARSRFGCRDTHCCPRAHQDTMGRAALHTLYQQTREVEALSATPTSMRVGRFLDERVRRVSDEVAGAAGLSNLPTELHKALQSKQKSMSRFRDAMIHLSERSAIRSVAKAPLRKNRRG